MNANVVVLTDVIRSRDVPDFAQQRDQALDRLTQSKPAIDFRHAITAWDEIQFLLERPVDLPDFFWRLITRLQPLEVRIGIGIGPAAVIDTVITDAAITDSEVKKNPRAINEIAFGPAFEAARAALSQLGEREKRSSQSTVHLQARALDNETAVSASALSALGNAILGPLSVLIQDISAKQWAVLQEWNDFDQSQTDAAEALGVNVSTVSRSLNRSNIWLIMETLAHFETVLSDIFTSEPTKRSSCT